MCPELRGHIRRACRRRLEHDQACGKKQPGKGRTAQSRQSRLNRKTGATGTRLPAHCAIVSVTAATIAVADRRKLLRALAGIDFRGIDIAVRVDGKIVNPVELAGRTAIAAERAGDGARLPIQNPDLVVLAVRVKDPGLATWATVTNTGW